MTPALVVKLGGSLAEAPLLRPWLRAVVAAAGAAGGGAVALVPGGGPFAEAVRTAQGAMGFDDRAAHDMALLGMVQYGRALASLEPHLAPAASLDAVRAACAAGRVPVWQPWPMLRDAPDIPASWDVTSDSLSLWLARALGAPRLLLVKSRAAPAGAGATALAGDGAGDGLVDAAFPLFLRAYDGEVRIAGPADLPGGAIDPATPPGRVVRA